MIIEGLVTSQNEDGEVNISPMGPVVPDSDPDSGQSPPEQVLATFFLRPFATSRTARNLCRTRYGAFHITDDVELLARAAVGRLTERPKLSQLENIPAMVLGDACRWYAFQVREIDDSDMRLRLECHVVETGWNRDFLGFNRAKHAVVEGAILATRVEIVPRQEIESEMARLAILVEKTAGPPERRAFAFLQKYLQEKWDGTRYA